MRSKLCYDCPRRCGAAREAAAATGPGVCGAGLIPQVARAALHFGEEPCISGRRGSGAVFFAGCSLRCVYCQNREISRSMAGLPTPPERLRQIFAELVAAGAHNINLVTPTHYTDAILEALSPPPPVPVVYNCGGYELPETLRRLEGRVQVYLVDYKYALPGPAARYSAAPDYPAVAAAAVDEMFRQTGRPRFDADGMLLSGVLIRHLVLPGHPGNTRAVIRQVAARFRPGEVLFSLMRQYTPMPGLAAAFPELARPLSARAYAAAEEYLLASAIEDGFLQDPGAAGADQIPAFDGTGIRPEGPCPGGDG